MSWLYVGKPLAMPSDALKPWLQPYTGQTWQEGRHRQMSQLKQREAFFVLHRGSLADKMCYQEADDAGKNPSHTCGGNLRATLKQLLSPARNGSSPSATAAMAWSAWSVAQEGCTLQAAEITYSALLERHIPPYADISCTGKPQHTDLAPRDLSALSENISYVQTSSNIARLHCPSEQREDTSSSPATCRRRAFGSD